MATDYQAIRLALARGDSWAQITEDVGCSRRTIDKAARAMKSMGFCDVQVLIGLGVQLFFGLFCNGISQLSFRSKSGGGIPDSPQFGFI